MPFTLTLQHGRRYLVAEATGSATLADLMGTADLLARVAQVGGYGRVLVNMLAMAPQLSFTQHIQLGTHSGELFARFEKIATVVAPMLRAGVSEKAAQHSGANVHAFTRLAEAIAWITAE